MFLSQKKNNNNNQTRCKLLAPGHKNPKKFCFLKKKRPDEILGFISAEVNRE